MSVIEAEPSSAVASHPEEIRSAFELRLGKHITLQGSARITPAGLICAGIAVAAMTLSLACLASAMRPRRY